MNNSMSSESKGLSLRYWVYVVQGSCLVLANSIIVLAILFHRVLRERKELTLPAALAFCDAVDGLAAVIAGIMRNWMLAHGTAHILVSRWQCFLKPWNLLWIWTNHIMDSTLLAVSCDRLVAVGWPLFHYGLGSSYRFFMVFMAWGPETAAWAVSVYLTSRYNKPERPSLCAIEFVYDDVYFKLIKSWRIIASTGSVLVYIVVIVLYWKKNNTDTSNMSNARKEYDKTQRNFTFTLGISCIFTTVLYVLPNLFARSIWPLIHEDGMSTGPMVAFMAMSYIIENFNKLSNIFIYSLHHRNIRLGIRYLFPCRELTEARIKNVAKPITVRKLRTLQKRVNQVEPVYFEMEEIA